MVFGNKKSHRLNIHIRLTSSLPTGSILTFLSVKGKVVYFSFEIFSEIQYVCSRSGGQGLHGAKSWDVFIIIIISFLIVQLGLLFGLFVSTNISSCFMYKYLREPVRKKIRDFLGVFPIRGGRVLLNPKTFVIWPSNFWHTKIILRC